MAVRRVDLEPLDVRRSHPAEVAAQVSPPRQAHPITAPPEDDGAVLLSSYGGHDGQVLRGRNVRLLDVHEDQLLDRLDPLEKHRRAELGHRGQHRCAAGTPLSGARGDPQAMHSSVAPDWSGLWITQVTLC